MARLPQPGGDSGNWGDILNDYLSTSLKADGSLKDDTVGTSQLKDNSVTAAQLAPSSVTKADVGLGSVDNTSDVNKPVSTAQQAALDTKLAIANLDSETAARIGNSGSATAGALTTSVASVGGVVDMLVEGAVANGATSDFAVFSSARTKAGAKGVVRFRRKPGASLTKYHLGTGSPDLSGTQVAVDDGVVLVMGENANSKTVNYLTPVTIENPVRGTTRYKTPAALTFAQTVAAIAANNHTSPGQLAAVDMTSWGGYQVSGALTFGTFTGTKAANSVTWGAAFASGQEGIFRRIRVGAMYECTFENTSAGVAFIDIMSSTTNARRVTWNASSGAAPRRIIDGSTVTDLTEPNNGLAYRFNSGGSITLGVRFVTARRIEYYINGALIETYDITTFTPVFVGFSVAASGSNSASLKELVRYDSSQPLAQDTYTVSIAGDSISYGAYSAVTWGDLLPISLAGIPGGGAVIVRQNLAVSSTTAHQWATAAGPYDIAAHNFANDDYVLVMLGTNDGQGSRTPAQYVADLTYIANAVVADGATPIFGIFPMWTSATISGYTGATTTNYSGAQRLRAAAKRWAASSGYAIAEVNQQFGMTRDWLDDNIHPQAIGQAAVAKAFAQAIARQHGGDHQATNAAWTEWTDIPTGWYANLWVADETPMYRYHQNGRVEFRGSVKNGTVGANCLTGMDIFLRPETSVRMIGLSINGATVTPVALNVLPSGNVRADGGVNTRLSLDGLTYSTV